MKHKILPSYEERWYMLKAELEKEVEEIDLEDTSNKWRIGQWMALTRTLKRIQRLERQE